MLACCGRNSTGVDKWVSYQAFLFAIYTLVVIAAPLLRQLRSRSHSYGMVDPDDVPTDIPTDDKYGTMESWHWVMDEMIWVFTSMSAEDDADITERHKNALRLFGKYYFSLWD